MALVTDKTLDSKIGEQALKLLKDYYMREDEGSPQDAYARACLAYSAGDIDLGQRLYNYVSKGWMMFASPVLSNAPPPGQRWKSLPISCFLNYVPDTVEGLIEHTSETRWLSVKGGGVGGHWSDVRSVSDVSPGPIPFLKTVDADMTAYRQGKTRKGSYAAYMDVSHPDIEEFLIMRTPTGGDPNRKCLNLHNAINLTDEFMERVVGGGSWELKDPHTNKTVKVLPARELWQRIIETRFRTGEPYLNFIDEANRQLPETQKKLGLKIHGSNLCFAGNTKVAVADGRDCVDIQTLADNKEEFLVWSARKGIRKNQYGKTTERKEWIPEIKRAVAKKTGVQEVIKVILSDGTHIVCTEDHKLGVYNGDYVEAKDSLGCKIQRFDAQRMGSKYRAINSSSRIQHREIWKYYNGDYPKGFHIDHVVNCPDDGIHNLQILEASEHRKKTAIEMSGLKNPSIRFSFKNDKNRIYASSLERNSRFSGISDTDLLVYGQEFLSTTSVVSLPSWRRFAKDHNLPQSFSKNRFGGDFNRFIMTARGELKYEKPIFDKPSNRVPTPIHFEQYIEVVAIEREGRVIDVYDLQVEDNHNFFIITTDSGRYGKGVLVHNCNEIHLATDKSRTAVCCLSSLNLEAYDEWKDTTIVQDMIRMLDNVLQNFIDNCPPTLSRARFSAERERSLGLGAMGFHSYLQRRGIPFESGLASSVNRKIFKLIKERAVEESRRLAVERGEPEDMRGTGLRNAHLLAVAPNANSAVIAGCSPSIEPWKSNAYTHRTRAGTHLVKNRYLEILLESLERNTEDVWQSIILNEGSVQHLDFLTQDQKDVFKTAFEIDQRWIIDHASSRQPYICQGQSVNLFFPSGSSRSYVNEVHVQAWRGKLKGLYYLRSTAEKTAEKVSHQVGKIKSQSEGCLSCHA